MILLRQCRDKIQVIYTDKSEPGKMQAPDLVAMWVVKGKCLRE